MACKKISVCLLVNILLLGGAGWCGKIVYPWNATTAIVRTGGQFTVWFDADPGQTVASAELRGPYNSVQIPSVASHAGFWRYDDRSLAACNTRIDISVPAGIPQDRYDLVLYTSLGPEVSPRAVKVIEAYKPDYTIFHMADTHLCRSGKTTGGVPAEMSHFSALVTIANILDPEMVFVTGDIVNANRSDLWPDPQVRWDYYYRGVAKRGMPGVYDLNAAVFSIPGNHDYRENLRHAGDPDAVQARSCAGRAAFWNTYCGLADYYFEYGDSRFIGVNNGWAGCGQAEHLARAALWLGEVGPGKLRVTFYHLALHHLDDLAPWEQAHQVQLALAGHNHHRGTMADPNGNPFNLTGVPGIRDDPAGQLPEGTGVPLRYIANSSVEYAAFNLFRVDDRTGNFTVVNPPKGNLRAFSESGAPNLTLEYATENNGASLANTATLVNRFPVSFPHARVRFVMPKGVEYAVSQGAVVQQFDGESVRVVDVCVGINGNSTTRVDIQKK